MEKIELNNLIQKLLESLNLQEMYFIDKQLETKLYSINGRVSQLTRALVALLNHSRQAQYSGGFLSIKTENLNLTGATGTHQAVKKGRYVRLTICYVEMENLNPFRTTQKTPPQGHHDSELKLLHEIMADHKGFMTVESVQGQSTKFGLYFPAAEDEYGQDEQLKGGNERILVVDDDSMQRKVIGRILKRLGYDVHVCSGGEEAVAYVKKHPQDLLILDMMMDGIDGAETYRQVLQFRPDQKAIILSGYALSELVEKALELGVGAFLSKPVSAHELAAVIRNELDKRPAD